MHAIAIAIAAILVFMVFWAAHTANEGFFATNPAVCRSVESGKYPQILINDVLDTSTCAEIIKEAKAHAMVVGGWETDRHSDYPTTDFDTADIPSLVYPIHNIVYQKIVPKMASAFKLDPLKLGINEVFVARYAAKSGKQRKLATHVDGTDFSFVMALNDDFSGGGTKFTKSDTVYKPKVGSVVAFCGKSRHQGLEVTSGTRYILTGFLNYETPDGCESDDDSDSE